MLMGVVHFREYQLEHLRERARKRGYQRAAVGRKQVRSRPCPMSSIAGVAKTLLWPDLFGKPCEGIFVRLSHLSAVDRQTKTTEDDRKASLGMGSTRSGSAGRGPQLSSGGQLMRTNAV